MFLLDPIRNYVRLMSRVVAFSFAGAIFLVVGLGFLTSALWLMLERWQDSLFAAQVLGFIYIALGLIFFAIAAAQKSRRRIDRRRPPERRTSDPMIQMLEGFLMGMDAGRRTSRRRPR